MDAHTIETIVIATSDLLKSVVERLPDLAGWRKKAEVDRLISALKSQLTLLKGIYDISRRHVNTMIHLDACVQSVAIVDKSKEHFMAAVGRALPQSASSEDVRKLAEHLARALRELDHAQARLERLMELREAAIFIAHLAQAKDQDLINLITQFEVALSSLMREIASIIDNINGGATLEESGLTVSNTLRLFDPVLTPLRKIIAILTASVRNEFQLLARNQETA